MSDFPVSGSNDSTRTPSVMYATPCNITGWNPTDFAEGVRFRGFALSSGIGVFTVHRVGQ